MTRCGKDPATPTRLRLSSPHHTQCRFSRPRLCLRYSSCSICLYNLVRHADPHSMKTKRTRFMGVNNEPQTSGNRAPRCIHAAHTLAYLSSSQCGIYSKSMNMYLISRQEQHILPTGSSRPPAPQRFVVAIQSVDTPREIHISLRSKFCTALLHTPKRKTSQFLHLRNCLATTFTIK
jgi:hypothetical protein